MRASLSRSVRIDLYPDVTVRAGPAPGPMACGWVLAGNQTVRAGGILRELGLPADMIATSDDWGVSKPDPGFFRQMLEATPGSVADRQRWQAALVEAETQAGIEPSSDLSATGRAA